VEEIIEHALAFVGALVGIEGTVVDLGSGGGVPGLVVAWHRPDLRVVLVDRRSARSDHLRRLAGRLALSDRVEVRSADAFALDPSSFEPLSAVQAVTARGFGAPSVTAAAASRLLAPGGVLVVSEPPGGADDRWAGVAGFTRLVWDDRRVARLRRST